MLLIHYLKILTDSVDLKRQIDAAILKGEITKDIK